MSPDERLDVIQTVHALILDVLRMQERLAETLESIGIELVKVGPAHFRVRRVEGEA